MEEVTLSLLIILKRSSIYPLGRNFMLNFKPGEYMGKRVFFKSVTQATGKKKNSASKLIPSHFYLANKHVSQFPS